MTPRRANAQTKTNATTVSLGAEVEGQIPLTLHALHYLVRAVTYLCSLLLSTELFPVSILDLQVVECSRPSLSLCLKIGQGFELADVLAPAISSLKRTHHCNQNKHSAPSA